ncbi:hypothetical protein B9G55_11505 [Saccharibacillus sp. O16]|nr:hypothetical protein B9G55_11505 [Saccharibacillus sp. O16]
MTWLTFALCVVVTLTAAVHQFVGSVFAAWIGSVGLLATIGWQTTESRKRQVPMSFLIPYLVLVMSLLAQQGEEFAARASAVETPFSVPGFALYSIGAASAFMLGACALALRHPLGSWSAWILCVWAVAQSLAHYVYPLMTSTSGTYGYTPGQWLAWMPLVIGLYGLVRLFRSDGIHSPKGGHSHDGRQ